MERSEEWLITAFEWRLAPLDVDVHLLEVLARRGSVLRTSDFHINDSRNFEGVLLVDGEQRTWGRMDSIDWPAGTYFIDIPETNHTKPLQTAVHLVDPVTVTPSQPDITVDYEQNDEESNGVVTEVLIYNRTTDYQLVSLEVVSAPLGWDAFVASDPVLLIEPHGKASGVIQVELMSTVGIRRDSSPVVIGIRTAVAAAAGEDHVKIAEVMTTCEIRARTKAPDGLVEAVEELLANIEL